VRAEVDVAAPELREALALDPLVLDVLRRRGIGDRRNDVVEVDRDRLRLLRIDADLARGRVEIAGRTAPLLPLAAVRRELQDPAVGETERLVAVEERLHLIGPGGDRLEALGRIPENVRGKLRRIARLPAGDLDAEDLLAVQARVAHAKSRLLGFVGREKEEQPPVERLPALVGAVANRESSSRRRDRSGSGESQGGDERPGRRPAPIGRAS
jgi:hypothetical protein